ncbi:Lsr2 family DNA-binding protein [Streptomyces sp. NBC_01751]|uniref:Lsr2 family DNA-binding protein n=1 Tax=Streptomyces sp. NBC_01751 TaxID=2975929 RepID=UPI002DDBDB40|nr:histone-like nucleoid-structuring protein Lsr2 [Streptomyces sp. NBC_01751]WSD24565.1 Lsr2 family protein [Streptomyces sp. NBC_01751]
MTTPDADLVREFMVISGLRKPGDLREVMSPELRFFAKYYPPYVERMKREAERLAEQKKLDQKRRESSERAAHRAWLMKDMRAWGPENGYFVGTRGRIPRRVIEAYNEAKGIK